jgi:guanylate kinase
LEVAAGCLQGNSQDRLKPVLEAFGILHPAGQRELPFLEDSDEDYSVDDMDDKEEPQ